MRYFFNLARAAYDPDVEGVEFATPAEARAEAVRYAGEMIRDHPTMIWAGEDFRVEVTDANQLILFTVIVVGVISAAAQALKQAAEWRRAGAAVAKLGKRRCSS
jgi:coenzyme F420-reducing hydrogenase alpha subunit